MAASHASTTTFFSGFCTLITSVISNYIWKICISFHYLKFAIFVRKNKRKTLCCLLKQFEKHIDFVVVLLLFLLFNFITFCIRWLLLLLRLDRYHQDQNLCSSGRVKSAQSNDINQGACKMCSCVNHFHKLLSSS